MLFRFIALIFLFIFSYHQRAEALHPNVAQQLSAYEEIFLDLSVIQSPAERMTCHLPKLDPLILAGYNYAEAYLRATASAEEDLRLLERFRGETQEAFAQKKLTLKRFKKITAQIAFLLANHQKKGGFLQSCEKEFLLYTTGAWKDIDHPLYDECPRLKCHGFEAVIFAENTELELKHFIYAFIGAPQYWITVLPTDNSDQHGDIACDPASAYLLSSSRYTMISNLSDYEVLKTIVEKIWNSCERRTELSELCLFLMIKDFIIAGDSLARCTSQQDIFTTWIDDAKMKVLNDGHILTRFFQQMLCAKSFSAHHPQIGQHNFRFNLVEHNAVNDAEHKLVISLNIENKPGEWVLLALLHATVDISSEGRKDYETCEVKDVKLHEWPPIEDEKYNESGSAISKIYFSDHKGDYLKCLEKAVKDLAGHSMLIVNRHKALHQVFANYARLLNHAAGGPIVTLHDSTSMRPLVGLFDTFYQQHHDLMEAQ